MSVEVVANCLGVDIPASEFLTETRIKRLNRGEYEGQEIAGALHVVHDGDVILEMGAGIGVVGAVVAKNRNPEQITSFEANPDLIPVIQSLYNINGISDLISVRNEVVLAGPEIDSSRDFHIQASYLGSSLIKSEKRRSTTVQVSSCSYDALVQAGYPDVILMDIEGGELEFLETADISGVRAMVIEFHPDAYGIQGMRRCKTILTEAGFVRNDELSSRMVWVVEK